MTITSKWLSCWLAACFSWSAGWFWRLLIFKGRLTDAINMGVCVDIWMKNENYNVTLNVVMTHRGCQSLIQAALHQSEIWAEWRDSAKSPASPPQTAGDEARLLPCHGWPEKVGDVSSPLHRALIHLFPHELWKPGGVGYLHRAVTSTASCQPPRPSCRASMTQLVRGGFLLRPAAHVKHIRWKKRCQS